MAASMPRYAALSAGSTCRGPPCPSFQCSDCSRLIDCVRRAAQESDWKRAGFCDPTARNEGRCGGLAETSAPLLESAASFASMVICSATATTLLTFAFVADCKEVRWAEGSDPIHPINAVIIAAMATDKEMVRRRRHGDLFSDTGRQDFAAASPAGFLHKDVDDSEQKLKTLRESPENQRERQRGTPKGITA